MNQVLVYVERVLNIFQKTRPKAKGHEQDDSSCEYVAEHFFDCEFMYTTIPLETSRGIDR